MIVEQKLDDCEKHGFQHSWKVFKINQSWGGISITGNISHSSHPVETPVREDPAPFIRKETTHVRKCQNCLKEELFEIEEVRKWIRK